MSDNTPVKNASAATVSVSTDELSDSSQSPKVTLLDGSGSPIGISPATETTLASLVSAEDAVHASGDKGIMALGVRKDTAVALAADGDYQPFIFDSSGKLHVNASVSSAGATAGDVAHDGVDSGNPVKVGGYAKAAAPSDVSADGDRVNAWYLRNGAQAVTVTAAGALIPGDATTGLSVGGAVAHDGVDSGKPNKIGFKATTSLSGLTLVADADRTDAFAGVDGVLITRPHSNLEGIVTGNATNTDGSSTQCIAAQAAGIKTYLSSIVLCNTSATAITVDIKDGSTVKVSLPLPAGSGCIYNPPIPIPGTAATAWNFDGSAAATTVTCSMLGFKSKV